MVKITWPHFQYLTVQADQVAIKGKGKIAAKEDRHEISLKAQNVLFEGKKFAAINIDIDQQKDACTYQLKGEGILNQVSARLSGRIEKNLGFSAGSRFPRKVRSDLRIRTVPLDCKFEMEKDGIRIHSATLLQGKQKTLCFERNYFGFQNRSAACSGIGQRRSNHNLAWFQGCFQRCRFRPDTGQRQARSARMQTQYAGVQLSDTRQTAYRSDAVSRAPMRRTCSSFRVN